MPQFPVQRREDLAACRAGDQDDLLDQLLDLAEFATPGVAVGTSLPIQPVGFLERFRLNPGHIRPL